MNSYDAPARRKELRAGYRSLNQVLPDQMRGFGDLHRSAMADGALSSAHKELIALAIGITEGCADCVVLHTSTVATTAVSVLEQFEAAASA